LSNKKNYNSEEIEILKELRGKRERKRKKKRKRIEE